MHITLDYALLLIGTGFIAGIINTVAGGGSNLTLPALMVLGMPPDVANATNRVGVFLQNFTAMLGFKRHGKLPEQDLGWIVLPTVIGGVAGAIAAAWAPVEILKPLLLGTLVALTALMLVFPDVVAPPVGTVPFTLRERPGAWWGLLGAGFYGGFIQAGVGFILISAIAGSLRYDLVRTNAVKVVCLVAFTGLALLVFVWRGQVWWVPGLILAMGSMAGAHIAVKLAVRADPRVLKWLLFLLTLVACGAALWT